MRLGSSDDRRRVLGWELRRTSPDDALLAASSPLGIDAQVLFRRQPRALLVATVIKLNNPAIRAFWTAFSPHHRRVVRHLLNECGKRALR